MSFQYLSALRPFWIQMKTTFLVKLRIVLPLGRDNMIALVLYNTSKMYDAPATNH